MEEGKGERGKNFLVIVHCFLNYLLRQYLIIFCITAYSASLAMPNMILITTVNEIQFEHK